MHRRLFSPVIRKILVFAGGFLLVALLALLIAPFFLKPLVTRILREKIEASTRNLYTVNFTLSSFSILPGHISLQDFSMQPDTNRLKELRPGNYYEVYSREINAGGIRFYTYLWNGAWNLGKVNVKDADVRIIHDPSGHKVRPGNEDKPFRLRIGQVQFEHTRLDVWNRATREKRFSCTLKKGNIRKISIRNGRPLEIGSSTLVFSPVVLRTPSDNQLTLDLVQIETRRRRTSVHTRQVKVNELADALGDNTESLFRKDAFSCTVDSLVFSMYDYTLWPYLLKKNNDGVLIDRVYLHRPVFAYYPGRVPKEADSTGLDPLTSRSSTRFLIRKFEIANGEISVWHPVSDYTVLTTNKFSLSVDELQNAPPDFVFPVWAHDIHLTADSLNIRSDKGIFLTQIGRAEIDKQKRDVILHDLRTRPVIEPDSFFRYKGYQIDYPDLYIPQAEVRDIDFRQLLGLVRFECREVRCTDPSLRLFRDKNYPLNTVKRPDFPQQQIRNVPVPFHIDSLQLENGTISYNEMAKDGKDTGRFVMDHIRIKSFNVTNDVAALALQDSLQLFFEGKAYGKGLLKGVITLYMNDPSGLHRLEGIIGSLQAQLLNSITVPSAMLMIRGGIVHGGSFRFTADEKQSEGTLLLRFERLKIALMETREGSDKLKVNKMKTFVANVFLVKENPVPGKEPVISRISYTRNPSRWVINYWWKSLLSGIDNIILARKEQMMELKRETDELKNLRENKEEYRRKNR